MAQRALSLETFSKVVETVDDCALDPERWCDAVRLVADIVGSDSMNMAIVDRRQGQSEQVFAYGIDESYIKLYFEEFARIDPIMFPALLRPVGEVQTAPMLVDEQEYFESRLYTEWCEPQGLHDYMGVQLLKTRQRCARLSVNRTGRRPRFQEEDLRFLRLLAPHLCRALAISDALDLRKATSQALEATLDLLIAGVFLIDGEGRVVFMNRVGEELIRPGTALRIVDSRLSHTCHEVRGSMTKAIANASGSKRSAGGCISIAMPAGNQAGLVATILPLDRGQRRNLSSPFAATAAIFVQNPFVAPMLPGEAFAKLYSLTGGELRVLLALARGLSVKDAAATLGIGEITARTHLQHIFSKTATSKQTELLRLFMSSTPPIRA